MNQPNDLLERLKEAEREIRALKKRMEGIAAGNVVRADTIVGVIPAANSPVDWYDGGVHLGAGRKVDLREHPRVWISGSFAAGRAYYDFGTYPDPWISGVSWNADDGFLGFGSAADLRAGDNVWISGSFVGGEARYLIGSYGGGGGGASGMVDWYANGDLFASDLEVDFQEDNCIWISGSVVLGVPTYRIGLYPGCGGGGGGMSGVDWLANALEFCFAAAADLREGDGVWISGACVSGVAVYEIGGYPAPPGGLSGVDFAVNDDPLCFGAGLDLYEDEGIWISGSCAGGEAKYKVGAYAPNIPTSISGVDFLLDGGELCFGQALDLQQSATVWISGSCAGGKAKYKVGAYAPNIPSSISGVDFAANDNLLCFGAGLDLQEGRGLWISGSCAGGEAKYKVGAYETYSPHAIVLTAGGRLSGCYNDVADFPLPAPFAFYARELRVKARIPPSFNTVFRATVDNVSIGEITLPSGSAHALQDISDVWISGGANLDLDLRSANWSGENFAVMIVGFAANGYWKDI